MGVLNEKRCKMKYKTTKDADKRADLKIMMKNVEHLLKHAKKDFM